MFFRLRFVPEDNITHIPESGNGISRILETETEKYANRNFAGPDFAEKKFRGGSRNR